MTKGRVMGWVAIFRSYIGSHWWASARKTRPQCASSRSTPLPHQHIDIDIDIYKFLRVGARKAHRKRTGAMSPPHQSINICICIHTYTPIYKHFSCIGTATWAFDVIVEIGLMNSLQSKNIYHVCIIPRYIFLRTLMPQICIQHTQMAEASSAMIPLIRYLKHTGVMAIRFPIHPCYTHTNR